MQSHNQEPKKDHRKDSFFNFTTTRPVAILMVVLGVCVFGWISYQQLPLNLMPDISYPSLTVRTEYPGTAPEEVETTVSRPVEQVLGIVNSLVSISSISKAGQSDVKLEYSWNTDMDQATLEVREKLDQLYLPDEVKRPVILRYDPSLDPIMRLGIYGNVSLFYLRYLAEEELKRILEAVEGVAAVKVKGGLEEEIRVEVDEQKLTLIGIDIQQVKSRLASENVNLAGGNLDEGQTEYLVRTLNEFKTVEEIAEVVIGHFNEREIKVKDIGRVLRTNKEREIITRVNEQESVEIEIYKEADANIVAVAQRVKEKIYGTMEQQNFVKKMRSDEAAKAAPKTAESSKDQSAAEGGLQAKLMTNFIAYNLPYGIQIETLSDQSIFPEIETGKLKATQGMDMSINIVETVDDLVTVKNVLVSVSDKRGLEFFIPKLLAINPLLTIFSTGGTFGRLAELLGDKAAGRLTPVSDYTGQTETPGGLVKTLDFKIYLGLLTEKYNAAHQADLERTGAVSIDMVVVNLYPFAETVAKPDVTTEQARGNIDIGGPCMIRASAKNFIRVASVVDPDDYEAIAAEIEQRSGKTSLETRFELARKAFAHTAGYDRAIADFLADRSFERQVASCYDKR